MLRVVYVHPQQFVALMLQFAPPFRLVCDFVLEMVAIRASFYPKERSYLMELLLFVQEKGQCISFLLLTEKDDHQVIVLFLPANQFAPRFRL